jgi:ABC-2 type transport system permease protein
MRSQTMGGISNILAVARREFVARASTRTFRLSTLLLVMGGVLVGLIPVVVGYLDRDPTQVAVYVGAPDLRADPAATLDALLNPSSATAGGEPGENAREAFEIRRSTDLEGDRELVREGGLDALLDVERDAMGDAVFTVYTLEPGDSATALVSRQAATSIAVADRLGRAGVTRGDQAALFAAPTVSIRSPDPSKPAADSRAIAQETADAAVITVLEMFLLVAIILYGNWVAQSVVEEKSSRMMEVILAAASPFQLLAGKILGVGGAALLQFVAAIAATLLALLVEGRVAGIVLGETAGSSLPSGLTPTLLVAFSILFVLGFLLYAALFAAAGSLVSRQEDVSQVVMPMTLAACAGYMIALYSSIGLLDPNLPWIAWLSWVPFVSPYMMMTRLNAGDVGPVEVGVAALLLLVAIALAAWVASRIYAAGVLMYGQKPGIRRMWAAIRTGS